MSESVLEFKNCHGSTRYDEENKTLHGKVLPAQGI